MGIPSGTIRTLSIFIGLSIAVHLLVLSMLGRFGTYSFAAPVNLLQTVMVEVTKPGGNTAPVADSGKRKEGRSDKVAKAVPVDRDHARTAGKEVASPPPAAAKEPVAAKGAEPVVPAKETPASNPRPVEPPVKPHPAVPRDMALATAPPPPLRTAGEFISSKSEKLTYLVSLLGIPVGSMELEATSEKNEVRITLKTRSNAALSSIYPVDDIMETRHIAGNFIITKIRQKEGSFSSDIGFTIFLRDKRVFWIDRLRKRYANETIPNSEVLDTLSSFYYLRNRPLQVGTTELLHIYDGDTYAPVPVEIVRQEEVRLRNMKTVNCLLLRHIKQKGGIFRRTGDMMIWLTSDENKVPVKMETSSPLGDVTIELVSAETQPSDRPAAQNSSR